jgi:hypothetical protein
MICTAFRVPRSTVYRTATPALAPRVAAKRGPKTSHSDAEVVEAIHAVLVATPFHGEGYRKVRAPWRTEDWPSAASASCG